VESAIAKMSNTFEEVEHLATTVIPLPYAQLTRAIAFLFLAGLPVAVVQRLGWATLPLCLIANCIYFLADECSAQMEMPFGTDADDIPLEKMIRRIDKHTAAQVYIYTDHPVSNYNIYPDARSTSNLGIHAKHGSFTLGTCHSQDDLLTFAKMQTCAMRVRTGKAAKMAGDRHMQGRSTAALQR